MWAVGTPPTLNFPSGGGTYDFGSKAVDPQPWDTLFYQLNPGGQKPLGYDINSSSGVLTVLTGAPDATVTIRVSDSEFAYADHTCAVTVAKIIDPPSPATFIVSVSGSTVTTRKVSNNQTWTGTTIDGSVIGVVPGNIIELKSGTYPRLTVKNLRGTSTNRITMRVEAGGLVIYDTTNTGFRWTFADCQYLTLDGATTNANAVYPIVHIPAPYRCGIRMNGAGACTSWFKFTCPNYLPKGNTVQFVEIAGSNNAGICMDFNDHTSDFIWKYPNQFCEDFTLRYCYFHDAGGCYLGTNYLCNEYVGGLEVPSRRTTVEYNRIVNTDQECCTLKKHWEGPNYIRYNWFENSGRRVTNLPPQRGIGGLQNSTAIIHDNFMYYSARGLRNLAQSGEYGYASLSYYGPDKTGVTGAGEKSPGVPVPASAYSGYGPYPYFLCEFYNNVIVDSAEAGIQVGVLSLSADPARTGYVQELPKQLCKIYNNTLVGNGVAASFAGINVDSTPGDGSTNGAIYAGSFVRGNISIDNSGGGLSGAAATLGAGLNKISGDTKDTLFVNPTATLYANRDYHLKKAVPIVQSGSVLGTNVPNEDKDGDTRTLPNADMGAYEYP